MPVLYAYIKQTRTCRSSGFHPGSCNNSTDTEAQKALRSPDVLYPGGYYQNGLYILPSTIATPASYGIVGHDRPCNPYNNNTQESILNPNCNSLTTIIVNLTTTTTTPLLVTADAGSCPMLCITTLLVTAVASSCFGLASYFQL